MVSKTDKLLRQMKRSVPRVTPIATDMVLPNHSGTKKEPVLDGDIATKKYVDAQVVSGSGDMTKAVYDTDDDGTVDSADTAAALTGAQASAIVANTAKVSFTDAAAVSAVATADDYLKNDAVDVGVGLTLTGDNSSADTAYVPMVLYNTDATPPAASGFPIGTIYIQYTA